MNYQEMTAANEQKQTVGADLRGLYVVEKRETHQPRYQNKIDARSR